MVNEFPFLREIAGDFEFPSLEEINEIKVQKVDSMLLDGFGYENWIRNNGISETNYNIFFVVVREGTQWRVAQLDFVRRGDDHVDNEAWESDPVPTNGEQILSMKVTPAFIVECEGHLADHDDIPEIRRWIIHKMNDLNLPDFYKGEIDRAALELKADIDRIYGVKENSN
ncbi:MAG: hypothetical protein WC468_00665 [Candidatus Paceibacterota bacterium]